MPSYQVRWEAPAVVTASVTVSLEDLARWTVDEGMVRTLDRGAARTADAAELAAAIAENDRLRDDLLRAWARTHVQVS